MTPLCGADMGSKVWTRFFKDLFRGRQHPFAVHENLDTSVGSKSMIGWTTVLVVAARFTLLVVERTVPRVEPIMAVTITSLLGMYGIGKRHD